MNSVLIIMFVAILVVGVGLLVVISFTRRPSKLLDKAKYQKDWLSIEQSVTSDVGTQQFAIILADKLLDRALKERGFAGQTMGERMAAASRSFTRREAAWAAHKLRNRIAHDEHVNINPKLTRQVLGSIKRALRDLEAF